MNSADRGDPLHHLDLDLKVSDYFLTFYIVIADFILIFQLLEDKFSNIV